MSATKPTAAHAATELGLEDTRKMKNTTDKHGPEASGETFTTGTVYRGMYKKGKKHGKGTRTFVDGTVFDGMYVGGLRHGVGQMTWRSGDVYSGMYKKGKKHGKGTRTYAHGDVYSGMYKKGKKHGKGTRTYAHGDVYSGMYKKGKKHGKGTRTYAHGDVYSGMYKKGKKHGKGTFTYANGDVYDVTMENDMVVTKQLVSTTVPMWLACISLESFSEADFERRRAGRRAAAVRSAAATEAAVSAAVARDAARAEARRVERAEEETERREKSAARCAALAEKSRELEQLSRLAEKGTLADIATALDCYGTNCCKWSHGAVSRALGRIMVRKKKLEKESARLEKKERTRRERAAARDRTAARQAAKKAARQVAARRPPKSAEKAPPTTPKYRPSRARGDYRFGKKRHHKHSSAKRENERDARKANSVVDDNSDSDSDIAAQLALAFHKAAEIERKRGGNCGGGGEGGRNADSSYKGGDDDNDKLMCVVCLAAPHTHLFVPCGHKCLCETCAGKLPKQKLTCPLCRGVAQMIIRVHEA